MGPVWVPTFAEGDGDKFLAYLNVAEAERGLIVLMATSVAIAVSLPIQTTAP